MLAKKASICNFIRKETPASFTEIDSNFMLDPQQYTGIEVREKLWSSIQKQCQDASFGVHKIHGSCYERPNSPKIIARLSIACNRNQESVEELREKGKNLTYTTERPISKATRCTFRLDFVCGATSKHWYLIRPNLPSSWTAGLHQYHAQPTKESMKSQLGNFTQEHLKYLDSLTSHGQYSVPEITIAYNKYFKTSYTESQIR